MTSTPTRPVDNVITTKGLQGRNINIVDGTTVENKGKLILNVILEQVNHYKYLGNNVSYTNELYNNHKLNNFTKFTCIINDVLSQKILNKIQTEVVNSVRFNLWFRMFD